MRFVSNLFLKQSRKNKVLFLLLIDLIGAFLSLYLSISIIRKQFFFNIFDYPVIIFLALFLFIPIFYSVGLYKSILRYLGFDFILKSFFAVLIYAIIFYFLNYFILFFYENLIITILQSLIFYVFVIYSRVILIIIYKGFLNYNSNNKAIIYGAGEAGYILSQRLNNDLNICCFVDDDKNKIKNKINNIDIYDSNEITYLIKKYNPDLIIIAIPSLNIIRRKQIIANCEKYNLKIKIVPKLEDLIIENIKMDKSNFITSDLINRNIQWNLSKISTFLSNKNILITGAGGSIGSELSRQLLNLDINSLILFDNNEYNLFKISNEFKKFIEKDKELKKINIYFILGDICDFNKLNNTFIKHKPDIVFHSAAYKHVSILENNQYEAFKNNILGTYNLMKISSSNNIKNFIFISTDKAIRPTSIMGASKRISEILLANSKNENQSSKTHFAIVRFGNVINSKGSVIPLFDQQIKNGGPVTITDPEVSRYFMSIPEAVGLVLETSTMAEDGDKYILNMGKEIKIIDVAKKMIHLAGYTNRIDNENGDIDIKFIGLRPGEKLHEDLSLGKHFIKTSNNFIFKDSFVEKPIQDYNIFIEEFKSIIRNEDLNKVKSFFRKYINDCLL